MPIEAEHNGCGEEHVIPPKNKRSGLCSYRYSRSGSCGAKTSSDSGIDSKECQQKTEALYL